MLIRNPESNRFPQNASEGVLVDSIRFDSSAAGRFRCRDCVSTADPTRQAAKRPALNSLDDRVYSNMARTGSEKEQRKLNNLPPSPVKSPTKIFQSRLAEVKDKKAKQRGSGGGKQGKKSADGKATTSGGSDDKDTAEKAKVQ